MDNSIQHLDLVRQLSQPGGPLATNSPHATINNGEWFKRSGGGVAKPRGARARAHREIRAEYRQRYEDAEADRKAIILAGPPGAGKGRVLESSLGNAEAAYLRLDADHLKELLLQRALTDGSYESTIKPSQIWDLEQRGETFYPLEMASLVHEESSLIVRRLRDSAMNEGTNLIIDGVLATQDGANLLGAQLAQAGYEISVVDIEVPFDVAEQAIRQRWHDKYLEAHDGVDGALGGRWIPSSHTRDIFDGPNGTSRPEAVAKELAHSNDAVTSYQVWRRTSATGTAHCETDLSRPHRGGVLLDREAANALRSTRRGPRPYRQARGPNDNGYSR